MDLLTLDPPKALIQLKTDGRALAAAARTVDLTLPIPCCPGWTVRDVVAHTGEVYSHKLAVLRELATARPETWEQPPDGGDVVSWFEGQHSELLAVLRAHDPATPVWSWYPAEATVGFWCRRMAQETVIHRADVELATGAPHHVDALVAVDGIDELLERFLVFDAPADVGGHGETVAVLTPDARWGLTLQADRIELTRSPGPADLTIAGTPSHVLYQLWGRLPDDDVDIRGDRAVLVRLRELLTLTTQ